MILTGCDVQIGIIGLCMGFVLGAIALGWVLSR